MNILNITYQFLLRISSPIIYVAYFDITAGNISCEFVHKVLFAALGKLFKMIHKHFSHCIKVPLCTLGTQINISNCLSLIGVKRNLSYIHFCLSFVILIKLNISGEKYLGNWLNNMKNGNGLMVTQEGIYYEGVFSQDVLTVKYYDNASTLVIVGILKGRNRLFFFNINR